MQTQTINLSLPRSWNYCSVKQLELIADVIREQAEQQDRYHPFSIQNVKIALFFAFAGLEIVQGPNTQLPVDEQFYICRLAPTVPKASVLGIFRPRSPRGHKSDTFSLYIWQINYWLNGSPLNDKGQLKPSTIKGETRGTILNWLDTESGHFLTKFPYPLIKRRSRRFSIRQTFQGPFTDLEGFTWSQYRLATEAMQNYIQLSNSLAIMKQRGTYTDKQIQQQAASADMAKSYFLATIFNAKVNYIETSTGIIRKDYHYQSNQTSDNAKYFLNFPDTQWQVILFWWTGVMHSLHKNYPHVFKTQKVNKKQKPSSAMSIYSATIATMQKYVGINEQDCNNQSYSLVLEQLERMTKENEDLERIRKKK